ncbi:NrdH-redoxin [Suicoccus acidiformans]|uniref:Glutaredoxin-like protein NrdH n=1 Tax=Suicoccus acidiformans TaxID=2036206 RepID=A0A347WJI3_9LACT|nr:glutaredoxin-like protein NrdH [Suicoccus acidiformans]AXY25240.1 NrdH-redoxin [Suicoccus acidiformans]
MEVKLYSKAGCGECMFTKKFFEKHNIDFQEINITEDPERTQDVVDLGFKALPVVLIEGQEPFSGYRPDKLEVLVS